MAYCYEFKGFIPVVPEDTYVHPQAVLIGNVILGHGCYIGPGASLRGDFGRIVIGDGANVQDNCIIHSFPGRDAVVESDGHIGHGAILHGCTVGRNALVGMNSVIMEGVELGAESIVGAQAFVRGETVIPPRSMVVGSPAKVIRPPAACTCVKKAVSSPPLRPSEWSNRRPAMAGAASRKSTLQV